MKNMITMMIGIVIGAITILIILTVTGRMNYATELESQLPAVVENILCNVKIKQLYNVADNQEFTADVTEQIAKELDAQTGIVMRIMGADKEKGLFSVGVASEWKNRYCEMQPDCIGRQVANSRNSEILCTVL